MTIAKVPISLGGIVLVLAAVIASLMARSLSASVPHDTDTPTVTGHLAPPNGAQVSPSIQTAPPSRWGVSDPWFSPDGTSSFVLTNAGLNLGATVGGTTRLIEPHAVAARWAPDSKALAVTVSDSPLVSEHQSTPLYIVAADGSYARQVAVTDWPRKIQFLANGQLGYIYNSQLHLYTPRTGLDVIVSAPSVDDDPSNDVPFLFAPDGKALAELHGRTLTVTDFLSGVTTQLTSTIDGRRWLPYSWSPDGEWLTYADTSPQGLPEITAYNVLDHSSTVLLHGSQSGAYAAPSWTPHGGWLIFAFYPLGTQAEEDATYEALNVFSGKQVSLFRGGLGLRLSPDGHNIGFVRTLGGAVQAGTWVAAVSF